MGAGVLPAVFVMVGLAVCVAGPPAHHLTSLMVTDYLLFYSHQQACLLQSGTGDPWVERTTWMLAKFTHSYVAVVQGADLLMKANPQDRTVQLGSHSSSSGGIVPCGEGLMVYHLETQNDARLFRQVFSSVSVDASWLLVTPAARVTDYLAPLYFPLNSRVTIAAYAEGKETMSFLEAYQVTPTEKLRLEPCGSWSVKSLSTGGQQHVVTRSPLPGQVEWGHVKSSSGLAANLRLQCLRFGCLEVLEGDPLLRRDDLTGVHLKCTTLSGTLNLKIWKVNTNGPPYPCVIHTNCPAPPTCRDLPLSPPRMVVTPQADGTVLVSGILGSAFDYMKEIANFTSTCTATSDGQWGTLKADGNWTGMIGDLVDGVADIAVASLDITEQRSSAVDFLMVIVWTEYNLVMKRPTNNDQMWSTFTSEFQVEVWWVLALLLALLPLAMHLATHSRHDHKLSIIDSITTVIGYNEEFRGLPSRLMFLTVMLLQVLVMAHYTSQLVSSMAVGPPLPDISTISDVRRHPKLRMGFIKGSSTSKSTENQLIWQSLLPEDLVGSREEGMERVLASPFVFLAAEAYLNNKYGRDCRYVILPEPHFPSMSAFAIKKGSPLVPVLNKIILRMKTTGLMMKWHEEWMPTPAECNKVEFSPVELTIVTTPFLLLGTGIALALVCFATENFTSNKKRKKQTASEHKSRYAPFVQKMKLCDNGRKPSVIRKASYIT